MVIPCDNLLFQRITTIQVQTMKRIIHRLGGTTLMLLCLASNATGQVEPHDDAVAPVLLGYPIQEVESAAAHVALSQAYAFEQYDRTLNGVAMQWVIQGSEPTIISIWLESRGDSTEVSMSGLERNANRNQTVVIGLNSTKESKKQCERLLEWMRAYLETSR